MRKKKSGMGPGGASIDRPKAQVHRRSQPSGMRASSDGFIHSVDDRTDGGEVAVVTAMAAAE